jgi:hypothetical protein
MSAKPEKDLYEPVRRELTEKFSVSGKIYLEVSADGKISETVKEKLDDVSLHIINFERVKPDLIGFLRIETRTGRSAGYYQDEKIVAEVKNEQVGIADIIQTKAYAEVFDARHAFLISSEPIPEEVKRFVKMKPGLLHYAGGYGEIKLVQFDKDRETFIDRSWYRESPFEEVEEAEEAEPEKVKTFAPKTWEAILNWAEPSVRDLVATLTKRLQQEFPTMVHGPLARWYAYYADGEKVKTKMFLALIASKRRITCRIRVDSGRFKDDERRTRDLRGWFYKGLNGVEKAFSLASSSEIDKAVLLIRHSYDLVKAEAAP